MLYNAIVDRSIGYSMFVLLL